MADAAVCPRFLNVALFFFFCTNIQTLQRFIHICGVLAGSPISEMQGGGRVTVQQNNCQSWFESLKYRKKLYWCSVRLLPKLFYSRWSYVAHRFKLAWAIWTVKSWDNTLTHTRTQALTNLPSLWVCMEESSGCSGGARCSKPPLQSDV